MNSRVSHLESFYFSNNFSVIGSITNLVDIDIGKCGNYNKKLAQVQVKLAKVVFRKNQCGVTINTYF